LQSNVPISKLTVNTKFKVSVASRAAALLASRPETKELAKKAFTSYLRSLQLLSHQRVDVSSLPVAAYASSLGLPFTPPLPFILTESEDAINEEKKQIREKKNVNRALDKLKRQIKEAKEEKKRKRLESKNLQAQVQQKEEVMDEDENDDLFEVKHQSMYENMEEEGDDISSVNLSKLSRSQRKKVLASKIKIKADTELSIMKAAGSKKIIFNDDDDEDGSVGDKEENDKSKASVEAHIAAVKARLDASRMEDHLKDKERVRTIHKLRRQRDKPEKNEDDEYDDDHGVQLAAYDESDADSDQESDGYDDQDDGDDDDESTEYPQKKAKFSNKETDEERILRMFG
jgi:ATP-dependent RNA helicase DDX10/DBP4